MNKKITISILKVPGAPSYTAVICINTNINDIDWEKISLAVYNFLKIKKFNISKIAILSLMKDEYYKFKFIQVRKNDQNICFESAHNCGNSMIAAGIIAFENEQKYEPKSTEISLINIDTKLIFNFIKNKEYFNLRIPSLNKSIEDIFQNLIITDLPKFNIEKALIFDVVNPYILINAKDLGIVKCQDILSLKNNENNIYENLKKIRKYIIDKYKFPVNSEFPKIAIVFLHDSIFYARTIYLDNWHPGLPITAIISISCATVLNNTFLSKQDITQYKIISPTSENYISLNLATQKNKITNYEICNIKLPNTIIQFKNLFYEKDFRK